MSHGQSTFHFPNSPALTHSHPKYRYIYIFWIIVGGIAALYAAAHHLKLSGGTVGATYTKWGMKRHSIRLWPRRWGRAFVLPSNSYLVTIGSIALSLILLATVGVDHVLESKGIMDFTNMHETGVAHLKRGLSAYAQLQHEAGAMKIRRAVKPDNTVEELTTHVSWQVAKSLWTQGNRWGFMAFAAMPLIVTLALKSSPFAIFSMSWFTGLHWDKVGTFHRAGGWLVWGMCTIHVVVWTVKLWEDYYDGRAMWFAMLTVYRFRCGITAYLAMTLAMAFSLRSVRDRSYEIFYWSHCILIFIALVGALIHHYSIAHWVGIALFLWGGDRVWRLARYWYINGGASSSAGVQTRSAEKYEPNVGAGSSSTLVNNAGIQSVVNLDPALFPTPVHIPPGMAQVQLLPSRTVRVSIRTTRPMKWHPGQSVLLHLPELSHFQTHPFTISNNDPNEIVLIIKARKGLTRKPYDHVFALMEARMKTKETNRASSAMSVYSTASIPRLSLDPVLIRAGVDGPMGSAGRVPWLDFSTALIVCGGSGVTFGLAMTDWLTREMAKAEAGGVMRRVRFVWIVREYAEITWSAGPMCRFKAQMPDPERLQIDIYVTNGEKSQPVRPRRQPSSVQPSPRPSGSFGFSTEKFTDNDILAPPQPAYHEIDRKHSSESLSSTSDSATSAPQRGFYEGVDPETHVEYNDVVGLTNFDGESDVEDEAENQLSRQLQQEGRIRRARSRRQRKRLIYKGNNESVPSMPTSPLPPDCDIFEQLQPDRSATEPDVEEGNPFRGTGVSLSRPTSIYSADSVERYEPFGRGVYGNPGPMRSPTSSMVWEDDDVRNTIMSLSSRTQSMVLLEDTHDGKGHSCAGCGRAGSDNLWIDEADYAAALILSESARTGRPKLASIVEDELRNASGAMIVGTCGPAALGTALRGLVSNAIDPSKIRKGDSRGHVTMYTEDFEM